MGQANVLCWVIVSEPWRHFSGQQNYGGPEEEGAGLWISNKGSVSPKRVTLIDLSFKSPFPSARSSFPTTHWLDFLACYASTLPTDLHPTTTFKKSFSSWWLIKFSPCYLPTFSPCLIFVNQTCTFWEGCSLWSETSCVLCVPGICGTLLSLWDEQAHITWRTNIYTFRM